LAKQLHWPARYLAHEWHHPSIHCQFGRRADIVEHCWFGRLQWGRQRGHSLAKQLHWPARYLAHEWHHPSIHCQFGRRADIVEHQESLTASSRQSSTETQPPLRSFVSHSLPLPCPEKSRKAEQHFSPELRLNRALFSRSNASASRRRER
jgi:hypothetical protein